MEHLSVATFFGLLVVMLGSARLLGWLMQKAGQPAVLGELLAGVVLGKHALGLVDPSIEVWHLFSELGVVLLLFSIGLETDLKGLLSVGPVSAVVAIAGVILPFVLGYATCRLLGLDNLVAVVAGAALTATSVGITARVLSDLGQMHSGESRVILGAAVIDDVIGLVILAVVAGLAGGETLSVARVGGIAAMAFGFLVVMLTVGDFLVARVVRLIDRFGLMEAPTIPALLLAFALAWMADKAGSAVILGAFAAGLLVGRTPRQREVEHGVEPLGTFFVPLFFVVVGAAVDARVLNPFHAENLGTIGVAALLSVVAIVGKFAAGYAPFWIKGRKALIGAGMIPRGEVGLIFAEMGRSGGVFGPRMFTTITLVVMVTTFVAPPILKYFSAPGPSELPEVDDPVVAYEDASIGHF